MDREGFDAWVAAEPRLLFLRKFLRDGRRVASVAPSSRSLARAATRCVDPSTPQVIVEVGAGTGSVTECALDRCHPRSRLLAIELFTSIGGFFRRLIVAVGEAARTGLDQIDETARQVLDSGRDTFERTLDSASSVGEASARFAERLVIRSLDAGSEMGGALRGALRDRSASVADRPPAPNASGHAHVAP
jgi:hypothetical protein